MLAHIFHSETKMYQERFNVTFNFEIFEKLVTLIDNFLTIKVKVRKKFSIQFYKKIKTSNL